MKRFILTVLAAVAFTAHGNSTRAEVNTYTVPVPAKMQPWATFLIEDAELRIRKDGRTRLEYTFPAFLIGETSFRIEAHGTWEDLSKPLKLSSDFGEFTCTVKERFANCRAEYNRKTLPVLNPAGFASAEQYLKANIGDAVELDARRLVLASFSHEAAGNFENLRIRYK